MRQRYQKDQAVGMPQRHPQWRRRLYLPRNGLLHHHRLLIKFLQMLESLLTLRVALHPHPLREMQGECKRRTVRVTILIDIPVYPHRQSRRPSPRPTSTRFKRAILVFIP